MKKNFKLQIKTTLHKIWQIALGGSLILALAGCSAFGTKTNATTDSAANGTESSALTSSFTIEEGSSAVITQTDDGSVEITTDSGTVVVEDTSLSAEALTEDATASEYFTNRDLAGTYDEAEATAITLSGTSATVSGDLASGVTVADGSVTITAEGVYILSGTFEGTIYVNVEKTEKVQLVLNGVDITCEDSAGIYILSADKTFITLAEGTTNSVTTGSDYTFAEGEDEPDAAIFSKDDLTINGSGELTVTTGYQDGIVSKDDLKICGGTITVTAQDDGIRGKDSVRISGGIITVTAIEGHAIKSTNDTDEGKGYIYICGGTLNLTTYAKDGLHAVSDITIDGGTFIINAADDGMHSDTTLTINDGTINIVNSYEGLEGYNVIINGGDITLVSSDDGINAAGGSDSGSLFPQDAFGSSSSDIQIVINGGTITLTVNGDGIDSNGSLYVNGGTIYVNGPVSGGNGSLDIGDWGCEAIITGGTIITAGTSDMAVNFDSTSTQPSLMVGLNQTYSAGTTVSLVDASGNTVLTYDPLVSFSCVIFSSPDMSVGETYTVLVNGSEYASITLTSTSVNYNVNSMGGFGGGQMGGFGGGQQGGFGGNQGGFNGGQGGPGQQGGGQGGFGGK